MRYLILLCLIPSVALALEFVLQIDGETSRTINADSAAMAITDGRVVVDVRTGADPTPTPTPDPAPDPDPAPTPDPPTCQRPPGVEVGDAIDLANPGGQASFGVTGTLAWPFRTTRNPAYAGQFSTVAASWGIGQRRVWISKCAGGQSLGPRCEASGNGSAVVRWSQSAQRGACELQINSTYWLNVQAVACPVIGCMFFRNIYTNGKP